MHLQDTNRHILYAVIHFTSCGLLQHRRLLCSLTCRSSHDGHGDSMVSSLEAEAGIGLSIPCNCAASMDTRWLACCSLATVNVK